MSASLESRVAKLERQLAKLQQREAARNDAPGRAWIEDLYGAFAGDAVFARAMKLGREYRRSLRLRSTRKARK